MADIVETATQAGSFRTLLQAAKVAGMVETLKGRGPYTVFAPNDDAFAKLPAGMLQSLLKDKAQLTKILTYHVVPGKLMANDIAETTFVKTIQGQNLDFNTFNGIRVNDAKVVNSNIETDNGVIHVIDSVIMPK